jgi:hypothetical protein
MSSAPVIPPIVWIVASASVNASVNVGLRSIKCGTAWRKVAAMAFIKFFQWFRIRQQKTLRCLSQAGLQMGTYSTSCRELTDLFTERHHPSGEKKHVH